VEGAEAVVLAAQPPKEPHGVVRAVAGEAAPLPPAAAAAGVIILVGVGILRVGCVGVGAAAAEVVVGVGVSSEVGGVGERGEVEVVGEIRGVLVVGGEEDNDAVVARAEVVEVDGAM